MVRRKVSKKKAKPTQLTVSVCKDGIYPTYKDVEVLRHFLTERGKIISRTRTGVSHKCQKHITRAIKQARHLALLPYVVRA